MIRKMIIKPLAILLIKYLQYRYKTITWQAITKSRQSTPIISKLILIQSVLYYFKTQFNAWGYFHPSCVWSQKDEEEYNKLFPEKEFKEIELVVIYNPEAITYYHNKIYTLSKGAPPIYESEIKKQLKEWGKWN